MQIQLCEDCTHLAQGEDCTIVDQRAAVRVERWQTDHAGCDIVAMFDTDTGEGVEKASGAACPCCGTRDRGARYAFTVSRPMRCDQCAMVTINGVPCHEHGCPNRNARWDGEQWVRQTTCHECGCTVDVGDECCTGEE